MRHFQEGIMCRREDFDVSNIWTLALKKKKQQTTAKYDGSDDLQL